MLVAEFSRWLEVMQITNAQDIPFGGDYGAQ
jgi:hypothetical protein